MSLSIVKKRNILLGFIIRLERNRQNLSLRQLADDSGITFQYLSDIERGSKAPSSYALHQIEKALAIQIDTSVKEDLLSIYKELYYSYVSFDEEGLKNAYYQLQNQENNYLYSFSYPYYVIGSLIYIAHTKSYHRNIDSVIHSMESIIDVFDRCLAMQYYEICGYLYLRIKQYGKAKRYFEGSLSYSSNEATLENAILCSHLCIYYQKTNNLYEAFKMSNYAISFCTDLCLIERLIINIYNKAKNYQLLGNYKKSIDMYCKVLESKKLPKHMIRLAEGNLGYCYLRMRSFDLASKYYLLAIRNGSTRSSDYFHIMYIDWKVKDAESLIKHEKEFEANISCTESKLMKLMKYHLTNSKHDAIEMIEDINADFLLHGNQYVHEEMLIYFDIMIDVCRDYKRFETANSFYERKIDILNQKQFFS